MADAPTPIAQNAGLNPKELEAFNPEFCEAQRALGEQVAKSGVGLDIYPGLKDKASFEKTIADALKHYPSADAGVVRQYQRCLADGFYGGNVPFDTGSGGGGGSSTLLAVGAVGVLGAVGWWMLKGKKR